MTLVITCPYCGHKMYLGLYNKVECSYCQNGN